MIKNLMVLLLIIAAPVAAVEGSAATKGIMEYDIEARTFNVGTISAPGEYINFTYNASRPHDYPVESHEYAIEISFTQSISLDSEGNWNVSVLHDGNILAACFFLFPTFQGAPLEGDLVVYPHMTLFCLFAGAANLSNLDHNHTLSVEYAINSGAPSDITNLVASFRIQRRDVYMIPQDANEIMQTVQAIGPLLAAALFILGAATTKNRPLAALLGLVGTIGALYATVALSGEAAGLRFFSVSLALAGAAITVFTGYSIWRDIKNDE